MSYERREQVIRGVVWTILLLVFLLVVFFSLFPSPKVRGEELRPHELAGEPTLSMLLQAYEEKVALLKWIGTGIVSALAAAIGLLYRTNLGQQQLIVTEIKQTNATREQAFDILRTLTSAVDRLTEKVEQLAEHGGHS